MKLNFSISEFCIDKNSLIPQRVANAILQHHIVVMQPVRDEIKVPVHVSMSSGFRPVAWEKAKGRSGNSQHTFPTESPGNGRGAADYTLLGSKPIIALIATMIRQRVPYTRIALYPGTNHPFIHCDYASPTGELQLIKGPGWQEMDYDEFWEYAEGLK